MDNADAHSLCFLSVVQQDALYDILTKCQNEPKWQIIYLLTYI